MLAGHKTLLLIKSVATLASPVFPSQRLRLGNSHVRATSCSFTAAQVWQYAQETAQSAACQSRKSPLALIDLVARYF